MLSVQTGAVQALPHFFYFISLTVNCAFKVKSFLDVSEVSEKAKPQGSLIFTFTVHSFSSSRIMFLFSRFQKTLTFPFGVLYEPFAKERFLTNLGRIRMLSGLSSAGFTFIPATLRRYQCFISPKKW